MLADPPALAFVKELLHPQPHLHSTDGYCDEVSGDPAAAAGWAGYGSGWHIDGIGSGFRELGPSGASGSVIPLLQLKLAYCEPPASPPASSRHLLTRASLSDLNDLSEPDQGQLTVIPASHKARQEPAPEVLSTGSDFEGALQLCGRPGTCIIFHNATYHTAGPMRRVDGRRTLLYYGYEHPWMLACPEQSRYDKRWLAELPEERQDFFHAVVFDPPLERYV